MRNSLLLLTVILSFFNLVASSNPGEVTRLYNRAYDLRNSKIDSAFYYCEQGIEIAEKINDVRGLIKSKTVLGILYKNKGNYQASLKAYTSALHIAKVNDDKTSMSKLYNNLGTIYKKLSSYELAIEAYQRSIELKRKEGETIALSNSLNNLAIMFKDQGDNQSALIYYFEALEIREKKKDTARIANTLINIGNVYKNGNMFGQAKKHYEQALKLHQAIDNRMGMASAYNNLGLLHQERSELENSIANFEKAVELYEELEDKEKVALAYINMGQSYTGSNNLESEKYIKKGVQLSEELGIQRLLMQSYNAMGQNLTEQKRYDEAISYFNSAMSLAKISRSLGDESSIINEMSKLYIAQKKFEQAVAFLSRYSVLKDSSLHRQARENVAKMNALYNNGKLEQEIILLEQQKDKAKRKRFLQWVIFGVVFGFVLIVGVITFRFIQSRKRAYLEISKQKLKVEVQRDLISDKNREITSSIEYAEKIQKAVLPSPEILNEYLEAYFVLYQPKDIVSGDFYWVEKVAEKIYFTAADCTGHGVPGAMISVVCSNTLSKVVQELGIEKPSDILDTTSELLQSNFERGSKEGIQDGMDLALCCFHSKTKVLEYSGANNPLYIIRSKSSSNYNDFGFAPAVENKDSGLFEFKADPQPIGKYFAREPFHNHIIQTEPGDMIYVFSDGFADQFGGPFGKKYKYKPFKKLLLNLFGEPVEIQHELLMKEFEKWRSNQEQVDDVCIMAALVE